jgi:beta-glucosidase
MLFVMNTRCIALLGVILSGVAVAQPTTTNRNGKPAPTTAAAQPASDKNSATTPVGRTDNAGWMKRHELLNKRAKEAAAEGNCDIVFLGDSITEGWEGAGKEVWHKYYDPHHAINIGISGDRTQHVLWRLDHGNVDGLAHPAKGHAPKLVVLMIGTNNSNGNDNTAEEIADGIKAIVKELRDKLPETKVLLLAIFPRGEKPDAQREKNAKASELASKVADGKMVHYLDIGKSFLEPDGTLTKEVMPDRLHPNAHGYEIWAEAMEPKVAQLLGEKEPNGSVETPQKAGS